MPASADSPKQQERIKKVSVHLHEEHARFKSSEKRLTATKALLREAAKARDAGDARQLCGLLVRSSAWLAKPELESLGRKLPGKRDKKRRKFNVQEIVRKALVVCLQGLDFEDPGTARRSDVQAVLHHIRGLLGNSLLHGTLANEDWCAISQYLKEDGTRPRTKDDDLRPTAEMHSSVAAAANVDPVSGMTLPEGFARRAQGEAVKKSRTNEKEHNSVQPPSLDPVSGMSLPEGFVRRAPGEVTNRSTTKDREAAVTETKKVLPSAKASTAVANVSAASEKTPSSSLPEYKFHADPADHAETPFEAYQDVEAVLVGLAEALGKKREQLRIWDPFFCQGSMKAHLAKLGFTNVHNVNEDFYKVIAGPDTIPDHDVLLTNPPFSTGHVDRVLRFCTRNRKPWMLLLPSYVHGEPHYAKTFPATMTSDTPMYIKPWKRYAYLRPAGLREVMYGAGFSKNLPGLREEGYQREFSIAPFESLWYISLYEHTNKVIAKWKSSAHNLGCHLFETRAEMVEAPQTVQVARTEHRPNPRARKRAAERMKALR